jgi:hypothetical protein
MAIFIISTTARADIVEEWKIEAANIDEARMLFEDAPDGQVAELISDSVDGGEEDREITHIEEASEARAVAMAAPDLFGVMIGYGPDANGAILPETFTSYDDAETEATKRANAPGRWACVYQLAARGFPVAHSEA